MSRRFHRWEAIIASNTCYRDDDASKSFVLYYSYVAKSLVQILLEMGRDIIKLKLVHRTQEET